MMYYIKNTYSWKVAMKFEYDIVERAASISTSRGKDYGPQCPICNNTMKLMYYDLYLHSKKQCVRSSHWKCSCGGVIITDSCQHFNKMCSTIYSENLK